MPLYDYVCAACGFEQEAARGVNVCAIECRMCGRDAVRVISAANFVLKGKGWAADGYGKTQRERDKAKATQRPDHETPTLAQRLRGKT